MSKLRPLVRPEQLSLWERQGSIVALGGEPITHELGHSYTRFMCTKNIRERIDSQAGTAQFPTRGPGWALSQHLPRALKDGGAELTEARRVRQKRNHDDDDDDNAWCANACE